jgi:chemotaxis receptor (MCP) glutamine deamidase CheD
MSYLLGVDMLSQITTEHSKRRDVMKYVDSFIEELVDKLLENRLYPDTR